MEQCHGRDVGRGSAVQCTSIGMQSLLLTPQAFFFPLIAQTGRHTKSYTYTANHPIPRLGYCYRVK